MPDYFGLDIGSSSIKVARVKGKDVTVGLAMNPLGKLGVDFPAVEKEALVSTIRKLIDETKLGTRKVVVGIPETLVVSKVLEFPVVSNAELAQAIKWQSDQNIPLPPDQIDLSWVIIEKPKRITGHEKMKVLVVAMPKKVSESYVDFLGLLGLEPIRAENESLALARAMVVNKKNKENVLIVDIGSDSTKLVLFKNLMVVLTYSFKIGGLALTRALETAFKLNIVSAEQYKRAYGVDKSLAEGKVYKAMEVVLEGWLGEVSRVVRSGSEIQVTKIILVGGGSFLKGTIQLLLLFQAPQAQYLWTA